jgi:transcriptional regulator with XRE-family HTH domain
MRQLNNQPPMAAQKAESVGLRVRKARKRAGLSQAELAKLCNITQATVQKIETSRSTNSRFLPTVWARLGLPLPELLGLDVKHVGSDVTVMTEAKSPPAFNTTAGDYELIWESQKPTWRAFDIVDLHYGQAVSKSRIGVAIRWQLRDGTYLIGVMDIETARRASASFLRVLEQIAAAETGEASPKR